MKAAVKSALIYPIGVLSIAGGVIVLLLWKVVPIFATLFRWIGRGSARLPTKIVIGMSNFVGSNLRVVDRCRDRSRHLRPQNLVRHTARAILPG